MNSMIESNSSILQLKLKKVDNEHNDKIANLYSSLRENYWTGVRSREYVDTLVEREA